MPKLPRGERRPRDHELSHGFTPCERLERKDLGARGRSGCFQETLAGRAPEPLARGPRHEGQSLDRQESDKFRRSASRAGAGFWHFWRKFSEFAFPGTNSAANPVHHEQIDCLSGANSANSLFAANSPAQIQKIAWARRHPPAGRGPRRRIKRYAKKSRTFSNSPRSCGRLSLGISSSRCSSA